MDIAIVSVEIFLAACNEGSFSKAARHLFMSEPAVSVRMRQLEDRLGVTLFTRTRGGIELTPAGSIFRERAEFAIEALQSAVLETRRAGSETVSRIRLSAPSMAFKDLLPRTLARFAESHTAIEIASHRRSSDQALNELASQTADCVIVSSPHQPDLADCCSIELFRGPVGLLLDPHHALAGRASLSPNDLLAFKIFGLHRGRGYWPLVEALLQAAGSPRPDVLRVDSLDGLKELTRRQAGVTIIPLASAIDEVLQGELIFFPVELRPGEPLALPCWFCYRQNDSLHTVLEDLAATVIEAALDFDDVLKAGLDEVPGCLQLSAS